MTIMNIHVNKSQKLVVQLLFALFLLGSCHSFNTLLPINPTIHLQSDSKIQCSSPLLSNRKLTVVEAQLCNSSVQKAGKATGIRSCKKGQQISVGSQKVSPLSWQSSFIACEMASLLTSQVCIAQEGYQVKFKRQAAGNLQAIVKGNMPKGFVRKHILPVVIELGFNCSEAAVINTVWQKNHIRVVRKKLSSYVWVGSIGLQGGMKKNIDDSRLGSEKEKLEENKDQNLEIQEHVASHSGPQWGLSAEEIEYLFNTSKDFVCILEFGGHFKRINQTWKNQLGWETQELLEVPYINFVHPDDIENTLKYEKEFKPTGLINRYRCKDGSYCWIDWIGLSKIRREETETINPYPLNIGRDVTLQKLSEEKRHQEEIEIRKKKQEELEIAALMRLSFLAHMSHEVRTPLTGLLGLLELIDKSYLHTEDLNYLAIAHNSGLALLSVLNNILDISKIDQNQVKLEAIEFNPLSILQEVVDLLRLEAEKKEVKLDLITTSKIPHNLVGDPTRFRQILFNLISNGVKFTSKGTVLVSIDGTYTNDYFTLIGDVIDTGIGISPEIQEKLFSRFCQGDESMLRRFGGTGLGLFISRELCKLMGGDITILSSEVGNGSTFRFNVNFQRSKQDIVQIETPTVALSELANVRVLVVDDNTVNMLVLTSILKKAGCAVTGVFNGLEAVEAVATGKYDIVLMDGEMPVMDGLEATKKIRDSFSAEVLPIIGVTAHAMVEDRERFLGAGMNGYLTKPIQKAGLFAEILRCLAETSCKSTPPEES